MFVICTQNEYLAALRSGSAILNSRSLTREQQSIRENGWRMRTITGYQPLRCFCRSNYFCWIISEHRRSLGPSAYLPDANRLSAMTTAGKDHKRSFGGGYRLVTPNCRTVRGPRGGGRAYPGNRVPNLLKSQCRDEFGGPGAGTARPLSGARRGASAPDTRRYSSGRHPRRPYRLIRIGSVNCTCNCCCGTPPPGSRDSGRGCPEVRAGAAMVVWRRSRYGTVWWRRTLVDCSVGDDGVDPAGPSGAKQ